MLIGGVLISAASALGVVLRPRARRDRRERDIVTAGPEFRAHMVRIGSPR